MIPKKKIRGERPARRRGNLGSPVTGSATAGMWNALLSFLGKKEAVAPQRKKSKGGRGDKRLGKPRFPATLGSILPISDIKLKVVKRNATRGGSVRSGQGG